MSALYRHYLRLPAITVGIHVKTSAFCRHRLTDSPGVAVTVDLNQTRVVIGIHIPYNHVRASSETVRVAVVPLAAHRR